MYEIAYGSKHDKELTTVQVAAKIRKAYRAAVKAGELPAAKVSITSQSYSGGSSIRAKIKEVPGGEVFTPEYQEWFAKPENLHELTPSWLEVYTNEVRLVAEWLQGELWAYNFDGSESMVDYFHVNYYSSVVGPNGWTLSNGVESDETKAAAEAANVEHAHGEALEEDARRNAPAIEPTVDSENWLHDVRAVREYTAGDGVTEADADYFAGVDLTEFKAAKAEAEAAELAERWEALSK